MFQGFQEFLAGRLNTGGLQTLQKHCFLEIYQQFLNITLLQRF